MGVGGDNSWGAPVHDEHLIHAGEDMEFEFMIQRI
jgi:beta-galactosidase